MFQRKAASSSTADHNNMSSSRLNMLQVEPLDEQEQQHIIDDLKLQAAKQTQANRQVFSMLFYCIAAIFTVCAVYTLYYPWTMEHQRHFKELLPSWAFLSYYVGSAFWFVVAGMVAKVSFAVISGLISN